MTITCVVHKGVISPNVPYVGNPTGGGMQFVCVKCYEQNVGSVRKLKRVEGNPLPLLGLLARGVGKAAVGGARLAVRGTKAAVRAAAPVVKKAAGAAVRGAKATAKATGEAIEARREMKRLEKARAGSVEVPIVSAKASENSGPPKPGMVQSKTGLWHWPKGSPQAKAYMASLREKARKNREQNPTAADNPKRPRRRPSGKAPAPWASPEGRYPWLGEQNQESNPLMWYPKRRSPAARTWMAAMRARRSGRMTSRRMHQLRRRLIQSEHPTLAHVVHNPEPEAGECDCGRIAELDETSQHYVCIECGCLTTMCECPNVESNPLMWYPRRRSPASKTWMAAMRARRSGRMSRRQITQLRRRLVAQEYPTLKHVIHNPEEDPSDETWEDQQQVLEDIRRSTHRPVGTGPYGKPLEFWRAKRNPAWQPKTGALCGCRPGMERDNCPRCEGTGAVIDFAAIRRRTGAARNPSRRSRGRFGREMGPKWRRMRRGYRERFLTEEEVKELERLGIEQNPRIVPLPGAITRGRQALRLVDKISRGEYIPPFWDKPFHVPEGSRVEFIRRPRQQISYRRALYGTLPPGKWRKAAGIKTRKGRIPMAPPQWDIMMYSPEEVRSMIRPQPVDELQASLRDRFVQMKSLFEAGETEDAEDAYIGALNVATRLPAPAREEVVPMAEWESWADRFEKERGPPIEPPTMKRISPEEMQSRIEAARKAIEEARGMCSTCAGEGMFRGRPCMACRGTGREIRGSKEEGIGFWGMMEEERMKEEAERRRRLGFK